MAKHTRQSSVARPVPKAGFAAQVRHARDQSGLNQLELARSAGISPKTLAKIEKGDKARVDAIVRLAKALGKGTEEWLELAGHDTKNKKVQKALLQQQFATPFPQLSPKAYITRMLERVARHGNVGLCCNCITSPVSVATKVMKEDSEKIFASGLHIAMVVPFPFAGDSIQMQLSALAHFYMSAYNWARQGADRTQKAMPPTSDRVHVFIPRVPAQSDTTLVYPPIRIAEYRPTLTQYGYGKDVLLEFGIYAHFQDDSQDHWVDVYSSDQPTNESAIQTFDVWQDYFRDIFRAWKPDGTGPNAKASYDLQNSAFWQQAKFSTT